MQKVCCWLLLLIVLNFGCIRFVFIVMELFSIGCNIAFLQLHKKSIHCDHYFAAGTVAFVVGGGNDQSYPNAAALLDNTKGYVCCCCHSAWCVFV